MVILFYRESEDAGLRRRDPSVCVHPLLTSFVCPLSTNNITQRLFPDPQTNKLQQFNIINTEVFAVGACVSCCLLNVSLYRFRP